jgi:CBS domain-containing protein
MRRDPVSVTPETSTLDAIALMREFGVSALPVVRDGTLVGIVSERDFMEVAGELLEERLRGPG